MHFAALHQIEWADYLQRMRDGVSEHGPVRAGVYAMSGYEGVDAHAAALGQQSPTGSERPGRLADQPAASRSYVAMVQPTAKIGTGLVAVHGAGCP